MSNDITLEDMLKEIDKLKISAEEKILKTINAIDNYKEILKNKKELRHQRNKNYLLRCTGDDDTYLEEITEGWGRGF